ncbi:SGNH/GDSL hydrolase family protein [Paenibacillus illinoisensis]|uniref:GDSL family lipase n=1 Tax=Paenibacillus illinoisensis TaxID=59845 RepID=A0A2W0CAD1_9BACL|nr:SGNH/GDSL hydrolase family protein [Paenibacillus illinoisensis]PYY29117.1 GDSL family lipase [Paenibacillus illinoisensis]
MKESDKLQVHVLSEVQNLKVHGRTTEQRAPLTLFWTGSAIEIQVTGSELWVELESDYDIHEPWISILINGVPVSRQMVTAGRYWICIFRGMSEGTVKSVRIVKDVQAMSADPGCLLQFYALKSDGAFLPVEEKPYKIEFIGDSITSGEGAIGARAEEDWIPMWFSAIHNYTYMTAEAMNADYRVVSQSGWGVLTSWDNNPNNNIPDYYEQVCGLLTGENNQALGAGDPYDFESWQPDVVVINLGSNDGGAFQTTEWRDPVTGKVHKQRLNEDGSYHEEDLTAFENAVDRFLVKLRKNNPKAQLVWAYGMLGFPMMPAIYRAVHRYTKRTGDRRVSVLQLPDTTEQTIGARTHPGELSHRRAAETLTEYLQGILA